MRFLILILFLNLLHRAGAQVDTNNYSANSPAQYQYYIFLSPKKTSRPVHIKKLCLNGQRHSAELVLLERPYIQEQIMNPGWVRRDTLTPVDFLPAYKINVKKPDRTKVNKKAPGEKYDLWIKLNIGKARLQKWIELPDWIMP